MKKRGQITIFLIAAIIVLSFILLLTYVRTQKLPITTTGFDTEAIEKHINDCLYLQLQNTAPHINPDLFPSNPFSLNSPNNFYSEYENNLKNYIISNIGNCIDFSLFQGYSITPGLMTAEIDALWDSSSGVPVLKKIFATLNYPLTIKKGDKEQELSIFETEYEII